jgi:HEAT repeat protein
MEQNTLDIYIRNSLTFSDKFSQTLSLLNHDNPDIVLAAVQTLYNLRDIRALEPLRSLLSHADIEVVHAAILAVGHLGDADQHGYANKTERMPVNIGVKTRRVP